MFFFSLIWAGVGDSYLWGVFAYGGPILCFALVFMFSFGNFSFDLYFRDSPADPTVHSKPKFVNVSVHFSFSGVLFFPDVRRAAVS